MKKASILYILLGIVLIVTGFNGTLGTLLGSIFTPSKVEHDRVFAGELTDEAKDEIDQQFEHWNIRIPKD